MNNIPFKGTYEPKSVHDLIYPSQIVETRVMSIIDNRMLSPIILVGDYGTGKTSLMRHLPKAIDPTVTDTDILWLNAGTRKNVNDVVNTVSNFCEKMPYGNMKAIIIDEMDNLDTKIQISLKPIISDMLGKSDVLFLAATNYPEKIEGGLLNRFYRLDFNFHDPNLFLPKMQHILTSEGVSILPDDLLFKIAVQANGSPRSLLRQMEDLVIGLKANGPPTPRKNGSANFNVLK